MKNLCFSLYFQHFLAAARAEIGTREKGLEFYMVITICFVAAHQRTRPVEKNAPEKLRKFPKEKILELFAACDAEIIGSTTGI